MPGAVVSRYLSKEALQQGTVVEVGTQQTKLCPVESGPSFHVQTRKAGSGIAGNVLSTVKKGRLRFLQFRACLLTNQVCINLISCSKQSCFCFS